MRQSTAAIHRGHPDISQVDIRRQATAGMSFQGNRIVICLKRIPESNDMMFTDIDEYTERLNSLKLRMMPTRINHSKQENIIDNHNIDQCDAASIKVDNLDDADTYRQIQMECSPQTCISMSKSIKVIKRMPSIVRRDQSHRSNNIGIHPRAKNQTTKDLRLTNLDINQPLVTKPEQNIMQGVDIQEAASNRVSKTLGTLPFPESESSSDDIFS